MTRTKTNSVYSDQLPLEVEYLPPDQVRPYPQNARRHSGKQVGEIAGSIARNGFTNPVLIDADRVIIAGHGRYAAALELSLPQIPCIRLTRLSPQQVRAYRLADNKLAEKAEWDEDILRIEFEAMRIEGIELETTGFDMVEIDILFEEEKGEQSDPLEDLAPPEGPSVTRSGDLWLLGEHRLLCDDATDPASYDRLMDGEEAQMVFTDPPYNVPIKGHVSGLGKVRHREFAMASGEMSQAQFTAFLGTIFANLGRHTVDGAIHYVFMDWRHMSEILAAGDAEFSELKNLVVWAKDNGGMGAFYRSRHELCFIFKSGTAPHRNNFGLGAGGRYRTNVWQYRGVNTFHANLMDELALHPTVKPSSMVADAILDVSARGEIVLDPFSGSGTTMIAAQRTARRARMMEIDPVYCDRSIRRWQAYAHDDAVHAETGLTFSEMTMQRQMEDQKENDTDRIEPNPEETQ